MRVRRAGSAIVTGWTAESPTVMVFIITPLKIRGYQYYGRMEFRFVYHSENLWKSQINGAAIYGDGNGGQGGRIPCPAGAAG